MGWGAKEKLRPSIILSAILKNIHTILIFDRENPPKKEKISGYTIDRL